MPHARVHRVLLLFLIVGSFTLATCSTANVLRFLKAQEEQGACEPWTVEPQQRCSYVIEHAAQCYPDGGWQKYLRIHFCTFANWQWLSLLVLLLGGVLCFGVLLTVSERFFCPALELISEYLRLPPVVAGATLLSFGNGAPDIFTQVAAVGQGGSAAVGMALSEPLGGGLFTSNIVFGLVVLVTSRTANIKIQGAPFIKDVAFYLGSLLLVSLFLADHKVELWEAGAMMVMYAVYVCATFYISRNDEPVHADVALHEVPQEEGVDIPDSCSETCSESPPDRLDTATSMHSHDIEAAATAVTAGTNGSFSSTLSGYSGHCSGPPPGLGSDAGRSRSSSPGPPLTRSSQSWRQRNPLKEPLLSPVNEFSFDAAAAGPREAPGDAVVSVLGEDSGAAGAAGVAANGDDQGAAAAAADAAAARVAAAKAAAAAAARAVALASAPGAAANGGLKLSERTLKKHKTFTEGQVSVGTQHLDDALSSPNVEFLVSPKFSPRAGSDGMLSPLRRSSGSGMASWAQAPRVSSPQLIPLMQQLQEQHQHEQQELLEQQYEDHLALVELHVEEEEAKAAGASLKHRLQYPLMQLLSCTMPRVGTGHGHHYQRWRACLLPLTAPLTLLVAAPSLVETIGQAGLVYSAACAGVGSAIIWSTYPASNRPRKTLKGVFAVMAFVQAVMWLNISASSLVQICVMLGVISGVRPALLGATVLAYGNAVPDLINNLALARDGFPSMAVAACFASPLFTLLVGMGSALTYGTVLNHGVLTVPVTPDVVVMIGFGVVNLLKYLLLVPLVFKFRMRKKLAVTAFLYYACFNVVYGLVIAGIIKIDLSKWG